MSKRFHAEAGAPVEVLSEVDLTVAAGEFVCVYGASGSGKTTLLHIAAGLESPTTGAVQLDGTDLVPLSEASRARVRLNHIGVVFQRDNLLPELSVIENVELPLLGLGHSVRDAREAARSALELVGVGNLADRPPARVSGGERQRVGIARGMVGDRRLLIADEPTGALDTENSRQLFELLAELAATTDLALLVATHDPLASSFASRVLTMRDGAVVAA